MMYTLRLSEEQVQEVRYALAYTLNDRHEFEAKHGMRRESTITMEQARETIAEQWYAQHVAQRDATLRESK